MPSSPQLIKRFRIYYNDGTTFTYPDDGGLEDITPALREGVFGVVFDDSTGPAEPSDIGRFCVRRWNFYIYRDSTGWFGTPHFPSYHLRCSDLRVYLEGVQGSTEHFLSVEQKMINDPDFRPKSANNPLEFPEGTAR